MKKIIILWLFPLLLAGWLVMPQASAERHTDKEGLVWICTGKYSKRYHALENGCKGMKSCKGEKYQVTREEAESLGKTPCGFCY